MKKDIPLTVLETLQPIIDKNSQYIKAIRDEKTLFHLIDIEEGSSLFFKVVKQENRGNGLHYLTEYKPKHKDLSSAHGAWLKIEQVAQTLQEWIKIVSAYENYHTVYDDPILKSYQANFLDEFDIVDEDADVSPFNLNQQMYLEEYLSFIDKKLEELKSNQTEEELVQLNELQSETKSLKTDLTKLSKRKVIKRLTKIWAKAQKISLEVIKEIFVNVASETLKKLLTGGI